MPIILCRRDRADFGAPQSYCCKPIARANPLSWCEECRTRLPLWPADEGPVAHVGRAMAEAFGLDKLPPGLVVIDDSTTPEDRHPMVEASQCPDCGAEAEEGGDCPLCLEERIVILPSPKAPPRCLPDLAEIRLPEDVINTTAEAVDLPLFEGV